MSYPGLTMRKAREIIALCDQALTFYANPESYFAVLVRGDRPCGAFADDISDTKTDLGERHGKAARECLRKCNRILRRKP